MKSKMKILEEIEKQWDIYHKATVLPLTDKNAIDAIKASAMIKALTWVLEN